MKRDAPFAFLAAAMLSLFLCGDARAQSENVPKVEVGAQFTSLSLNVPEEVGTEQLPGFGGRFTYNLNDHVAIEAEGNFLPHHSFRNRAFLGTAIGGRAFQGQFGAKVGKRWDKFGVFAKARPGFLSFGETIQLSVRDERLSDGRTIPIVVFDTERKTHFSMDVGGVLEFYPSRRVLVRFDAGDTIIRYGERPGFPFTPSPQPLLTVPAETRHNFQFSAGVGFRFHDPAGDGAVSSSGASVSDEGTPRYELSVLFTSLVFNQPTLVFGFPNFVPDDLPTNTESGFGGRFTFNLNDNVALEAEGNFFPRESFAGQTYGGFPAQAQFGAKVGRRWEKFGVFAKGRPGFVTFSRVRQLVGTQNINLGGFPFEVGIFEDKRKTYFSTDVGGVFELYPSRRVVTRFDFGDTIIRYDTRHEQTIFLSQNVLTIPPETRHNFQFSAGLGFRF